MNAYLHFNFYFCSRLLAFVFFLILKSFRFLLLFFFLFPSVSQASYTFQPKFYPSYVTPNVYFYYSSVLSDCKTRDASGTTLVYSGTGMLYCNNSVGNTVWQYSPSCRYSGSPDTSTSTYNVTTHLCESPNTPSCSSGQTWDSTTSSCKTDCSSVAGTVVNLAVPNSTGTGATACSNGCYAYLYDGGYSCTPASGSSSGTKYLCGTYKIQNESCTASTTNTPASTSTSEIDCLKKGKNFGYVNGAVVCVTSSASKTTSSSSSSTTSSSGTSSSVTSTSSTVNSDGTVSTTKTTTTTNADGTTTTTSSTGTSDKSSFCEENPESSICKEGSFTGDCGSDFTCDGDAVQCASAKAAWYNYCALKTDANHIWVTSAQSIASDGSMGDGLKANLAIETKDFSSVINTTRSLSSSCWADSNYSLLGQTLVIPFSKLCYLFSILGYMAVAVTWVVCARIVFGGK